VINTFSALVVLLHDGQLGFDGHVVMLFKTDDEATKFASDRLVEYGAAVRVDGGFRLADDSEEDRILTAAELVKVYQEGCGITEYFQIETAKVFTGHSEPKPFAAKAAE